MAKKKEKPMVVKIKALKNGKLPEFKHSDDAFDGKQTV